MLTLKRTYENPSVGPWSYEDYDVFDGDRRIGRVLRYPQGAEGRSWFWSTDASDPGNTYDRGYAASREQAMTDFKARLHAHRMPQILAA
jgi:hypothetical protein